MLAVAFWLIEVLRQSTLLNSGYSIWQIMQAQCSYGRIMGENQRAHIPQDLVGLHAGYSHGCAAEATLAAIAPVPAADTSMRCQNSGEAQDAHLDTL